MLFCFFFFRTLNRKSLQFSNVELNERLKQWEESNNTLKEDLSAASELLIVNRDELSNSKTELIKSRNDINVIKIIFHKKKNTNLTEILSLQKLNEEINNLKLDDAQRFNGSAIGTIQTEIISLTSTSSSCQKV